MTILALLRHAKAVKDDPAGDHARRLSDAGRRAAVAAGHRLAPHLPVDVLVVASDARRTRETAERAFPDHAASRLQLEPSLYGARAASLLAFVRDLPADTPVAVVVGHNPGISELASMLAGEGDPVELARAAKGLATADAVVFEFPTGWAGIAPKRGRITQFLAREDVKD